MNVCCNCVDSKACGGSARIVGKCPNPGLKLKRLGIISIGGSNIVSSGSHAPVTSIGPGRAKKVKGAFSCGNFSLCTFFH